MNTRVVREKPSAVAARVLVIGDVMLDQYLWGTATRMSPEAPVLVLQADGEEIRLGGAASVAGLLRGLGCQVMLAGVIGQDVAGRQLQMLLCEMGITADGVVVDDTRPTTTKQRIEGRTAQRQPQQIVRVDHETTAPISPELTRQLLGVILEQLPAVHAVVISDYGKGVCTAELLRSVMDAAIARKIPVLVDPARGVPLTQYRGATLLKPNRHELELLTGTRIVDTAAAVEAGSTLFLNTEDTPALLVTLDREGMVLLESGREPRVFPAEPRDVTDITGAGDMVMATLAWGLAQGWSIPAAIPWANAAAGLQVERLGVAPITLHELRRAMKPGHNLPPAKVVTSDELLAAIAQERRQGHSIVLTNGCFDLLHVGHLTCLEQAAELGDVLVVAINSDASVGQLKGPTRPVIPEQDRARLLAGLACVSYVTVFGEETPHLLLRAVRPDVLVKGGTTGDIIGRGIVEAYGGTVCHVGETPGLSTTLIVERLLHVESAPCALQETGRPS